MTTHTPSLRHAHTQDTRAFTRPHTRRQYNGDLRSNRGQRTRALSHSHVHTHTHMHSCNHTQMCSKNCAWRWSNDRLMRAHTHSLSLSFSLPPTHIHQHNHTHIGNTMAHGVRALANTCALSLALSLSLYLHTPNYMHSYTHT